jgi:hypothetical protein
MECQNPRYLHKQDMIVPCGKCVFCSQTKRSDWALRLHYEGKKHLVKKFVTLTYADPHLRFKKGSAQLCKADLQLWFKKVRRTGAKIRYYAVGEYGSKTYRPHYHVILFGDVDDSVLTNAWSFGMVHIGTVTQASIMYCLGYIVNGKGYKMRTGREAPFALMSLRPGLGSNYLTKAMVEWHRSGRKNYAILDGVKRHLPRYYKVKIFSKIDLVRIAVRDQKALFNAAVKWVRSPAMRRQKDPLAYRQLQLDRLAMQIRAKSKETLII